MTASGVATLKQRAEEFATELTTTFRGAFGESVPSFVAEASPKVVRGQTRVSVHSKDSEDIELEIGDQHALTLVVEFECAWDSEQTFLAVKKANFHVLPAGETLPLFRYEFVDGLSNELFPSAHLHVHAHRDEFLYAMLRGEKGKSKTRAAAAVGASKRAVPRLAELHFPLGGVRMRPCVEDVLQMLIVEFGVKTTTSCQDVLNEGRARWRRRQIGACVRDAPAEAVRVLVQMGYEVTEPTRGAAVERTDRLHRI